MFGDKAEFSSFSGFNSCLDGKRNFPGYVLFVLQLSKHPDRTGRKAERGFDIRFVRAVQLSLYPDLRRTLQFGGQTRPNSELSEKSEKKRTFFGQFCPSKESNVYVLVLPCMEEIDLFPLSHISLVNYLSPPVVHYWVEVYVDLFPCCRLF
ncbi:hypothetical protein K435DRAFT_794800 [Dendrothele bispora CBS 962.96]|uniref:Uncharacterized protein n=1 Tax=Dendrothele bispora (strain CBS 962.96) TaxID=1314807 RepID=A0A4S8MBK8_DENBC|nr:hypothetical protein K435DRAFT_794800 [Dendrothele bispora CBS 962.96]